MKSRSRQPSNRRPYTHRTPGDGGVHGVRTVKGKKTTKFKTYPNGIQVTFGALWQYWWQQAKPDALPDGAEPETSAKQFAEIFNIPALVKELTDKYKGIKAPADLKKAGESFQEIGNGTIVGLDYFSLRLASDLVGLPLGLFILFTHFVSKERRQTKKLDCGEITLGEKREDLMLLAKQIEAFAVMAKTLINNSVDVDQIFYEEFDPAVVRSPGKHAPDVGEAHYLARLDILNAFVKAINEVK